jgi:hypothetical protein
MHVGVRRREIVALSATMCVVCAARLFYWTRLVGAGCKKSWHSVPRVGAKCATTVFVQDGRSVLVCRKSWHSVPRRVSYVQRDYYNGHGYCVLVCEKSWHSVPRRCAVCTATFILSLMHVRVRRREIVALSATVCAECTTKLLVGDDTAYRSARNRGTQCHAGVPTVRHLILCGMGGQCWFAENRGTQCHGVYGMCDYFILLEIGTVYLSARNRGTQCHAGVQSVRQLLFCRWCTSECAGEKSWHSVPRCVSYVRLLYFVGDG